MQDIKSEYEYKVCSVGWISHEIHREGGVVNSIHRVGWGEVEKISLNNLICHKLGILSFLLTNYCQWHLGNVVGGMIYW